VILLNLYKHAWALPILFLLVGLPLSVSASSWVDVQQTTITAGGHWEDIQETSIHASTYGWADVQMTTIECTGFDPFALDITDMVTVIIFFLPVMIIGSKFGPLGIVGGLGIMTFVFMFGMSNFLIGGSLNIIGLIVYLYASRGD